MTIRIVVFNLSNAATCYGDPLTIKRFLLLLHYSKFAIVMNCNINISHWLSATPVKESFEPQRGYDSQVENLS